MGFNVATAIGLILAGGTSLLILLRALNQLRRPDDGQDHEEA